METPEPICGYMNSMTRAPDRPKEVEVALREAASELAKLYGERLAGVFLYGSYARGTAIRDESDVDILVVLEGKVEPGKELDQADQVLSDLAVKHNLLPPLPIAKTESEEANGPFMQNVRRDAIRL